MQRVLPEGIESVTGTEVAAEGEEGIAGLMDAFRNILLGFAAVALFVSAFFINNTFSIVVGQRTRQLALLRAVGASAGQITRSVVGEALVVGALASAVGIAFGLVIALVLQAILNAAGFGLPDQGLVLATRTVAAGLIVGLGVTLVASLAPARRASTVPPVQGMQEGFQPAAASRTRRTWSGGGLTLLGAGLVIAGLRVAEETMTIVALLGLGAFSVFIGVALLSPVVAVPIAGTLGRPIAPMFRVAGRLANANAVRNPERTSKTAAALMIGLALVTTVFIVGTSMKKTFAEAIEGSVGADYVLSTAGFTGFSPELTADLAEIPEVSAVTGVRFNTILIEGNSRDVVAADAAVTDQLVDIDVQTGSLADLDDATPSSCTRTPPDDLGVTVGDHVTVEMAVGGPRELTVAGTYADAAFAGNYLIDLELFTEGYPTSNLDFFAFARLTEDADPAAARAAIDDAMTAYPQVTLEDRSEWQASQEAQFDSLLIAVNGLLGLALFIALLGIANTLALSVLERTREIGLLRAVGMLRRQVREMVLAESAMVAIFGAVLGVAIGTAFGVAIAVAMPPSVVTVTAIPYRNHRADRRHRRPVRTGRGSPPSPARRPPRRPSSHRQRVRRTTMHAPTTVLNLIDSGPTDEPDREPRRQCAVLDGT